METEWEIKRSKIICLIENIFNHQYLEILESTVEIHEQMELIRIVLLLHLNFNMKLNTAR